jgi:ribosome assembly protein 1
MGSLIVRDINIDLEQKSKIANENEASNQTNEDIDLDLLIQEKENELHFSPEKGNVIFASAIDCWAFSIESFADILCSKLGFKKEALVKLLWGDFFLNPKTKKVSNVPFSEKSRPMFVELVLNNIYKLYNIVIEERNQESVLKACKSLNISLTKNDMNCLEKDKDSRPLLKTIMRQWLAVPNNIFDCIVNKLPDPFKSIQQGKFDVVFPKYKSLINKNQFFGVVQKLMETGSSESNTIIGFISKMIAVPRRFIGDEVIGPEEDGNEVRFMGKLFV